MFDRSQTFQRMGGGSQKVISVNLGHVPYLEDDPAEERRWRRIAIAGAIALHILLFVVTVPASEVEPRTLGPRQQVYVVQPVRFKPPPPAQAEQMPKPKEKRRVIPIPDPTPEEPEPIREVEVEVPEFDPTLDSVSFGIPDAPPAGYGIVGGEPRRLGGGIVPPVKIYYPQPKYTEEGRLSRVQGVVILEAIIDAAGDVQNVKVLKGLPMGLSEEAVATAKEWKFKPATLDGQPVPVFLNLTIRFSLQ